MNVELLNFTRIKVQGQSSNTIYIRIERLRLTLRDLYVNKLYAWQKQLSPYVVCGRYHPWCIFPARRQTSWGSAPELPGRPGVLSHAFACPRIRAECSVSVEVPPRYRV